MRTASAVLILFVLGAPLTAQDTAAPVRRLSVVLTGGGSAGGPVSAVGGQLSARGFGDTEPYGCVFWVFCSGPTDYPQVYSGTGVGGVGVRYEIGPRWAVSGALATADFGSAAGYRAAGGTHLFSAWEATAIWVAGHFDPADILSIGGGMSLHRFRGGDPGRQDPQQFTKAGVLAEAAVRLPAARRFFWETTLRGHWLPGAAQVDHGITGGMTLPVRWSYVTLVTGVGIRL